MSGYNFTERVRKVLAMAREEAARLHHEYVGTEHILLGLLREGEGLGVAVVQNLGVDLARVTEEVDAAVRSGNASRHIGPDLPYTARAKEVLALAMGEARDLHQDYIGTEHLLLGLLREQKGIAARSLAGAGVTTELAHAELSRLIGRDVAPIVEPPPERRAAGGAAGGALSPDAAPPATAPWLVPASRTRRPDDRWMLSHLFDFTPAARRALLAAQDGAARRGHPLVEPEHALLALLMQQEGGAARLFARLRTDVTTLRSRLEHDVERDRSTPTIGAARQYGARTKRVVALAMVKACDDGADLVDTAHLLAGMVQDGRGAAAAALNEAGVTLAALRGLDD